MKETNACIEVTLATSNQNVYDVNVTWSILTSILEFAVPARPPESTLTEEVKLVVNAGATKQTDHTITGIDSYEDTE